MREFNNREKNFGVLTVVICGMLISYSVNRRTTKAVQFMIEELDLNQQKITKAQELLSDAEKEKQLKEKKPEVAQFKGDRMLSVNLMKDLTSSGQLNNIKVLSAEKVNPDTFKINIEAEFVEMMRFFTYLERQDGKFAIGSAQVSRPNALGAEGKAPSRHLNATFQLGAKS